MIRKIRLLLATLFLIGLTLLFLDFTGTAHRWLGWMAKVQFLPAVLALNVAVVAVLVVLTLVFGRIYCSVICPLGIMQDVFGWLGKKARKRRYTSSPERRWLRYGVLAVFVVCLAAGVASVVQLLAPYSAFGRIMTSLFQPLWQLGNNVLAGIAERADSYTFYSVDVWLKSLPVLIIAVVTLVALGVMAWRNGRTYCNTICPVGTVLSLLSRFSLLKVRFQADKCRNCSLCTKSCKASCIDYKTHTVDYSRCVVCGDCLDQCHFGALTYGLARRGGAAPSAPQGPVDPTKRSFLLASAMAATALFAEEQKKLVDGGLAPIQPKAAPERKSPLTPPGALSAANMQRRCTGCQLCVSECPNQVLRPGTSLLSLMQPVMSYERGYCRPECTRCSQVCPTGAIKPIDREEKTSVQIGLAVVSAEHCLSAIGEVECGNCQRHCPAGAIAMVPSDPADDLSPLVPAVDERRCIGCGACEYVCPVRPLSAIHVEGLPVHSHI